MTYITVEAPIKDVFDEIVKTMDAINTALKLLDGYSRKTLYKKTVKSLMEEVKFHIPDGILSYQNERKLNLGMIAADYKFAEIAKMGLDDENARKQVDNDFNDIAKHCAAAGLINETLYAITFPEVLCSQNIKKQNIGHICVDSGILDGIYKALDNVDASLQKDWTGKIIGMKCAINGLEQYAGYAMNNKAAALTQDTDGNTISHFCLMQEKPLVRAVSKSLKYPEILNIKNNHGETIVDLAKQKKYIIKGNKIKKASTQTEKQNV